METRDIVVMAMFVHVLYEMLFDVTAIQQSLQFAETTVEGFYVVLCL